MPKAKAYEENAQRLRESAEQLKAPSTTLRPLADAPRAQDRRVQTLSLLSDLALPVRFRCHNDQPRALPNQKVFSRALPNHPLRSFRFLRLSRGRVLMSGPMGRGHRRPRQTLPQLGIANPLPSTDRLCRPFGKSFKTSNRQYRTTCHRPPRHRPQIARRKRNTRNGCSRWWMTTRGSSAILIKTPGMPCNLRSGMTQRSGQVQSQPTTSQVPTPRSRSPVLNPNENVKHL